MDDPFGGETILEPGGPSSGRFSKGDDFEEYRILGLLGRGGLGEVYEAEHRVLRQSFALKFLRVDLKQHRGLLERFEREAQVMAGLRHPHILEVSDFRVTNGLPSLRVELCEGIGDVLVTLEDFEKKFKGDVKEELLISVLQQMLEAVGFAHSKGVIHRDLKPSNILLFHGDNDSLAIKVGDFGLVRIVGEQWLVSQTQISMSMSMGQIPGAETIPDQQGSATRSLVGTRDYMSPERQAGNDGDESDDCYAISLMTWRLLTGEPRPSLERATELREVNPRWDEFFSRGLATRKSKRFKSTEEIEKFLEINFKKKAPTSEKSSVPAPAEEKQAVSDDKIPSPAAKHRTADVPSEKNPSTERKVLTKEDIDTTNPEPKRSPWKSGLFWTILIGTGGFWLWNQASTPARRSQKISKTAPTGQPTPSSRDLIAGSTHNPPTYTNQIGMKFVLIPAGSFQMGSPSLESGRNDDEGPVHEVKITRAFYLGKYEVTQGQWEDVMGANPSAFKNCGRNCPVESVSWNDVQEFIKNINAKEGCIVSDTALEVQQGGVHSVSTGCYRLPTEAEWEYAARAGTRTPFSFGTNISPEDVNYDEDYPYGNESRGLNREKTVTVGSLPANPWGLHEVHGNVWEWVMDWHELSYYWKLVDESLNILYSSGEDSNVDLLDLLDLLDLKLNDRPQQVIFHPNPYPEPLSDYEDQKFQNFWNSFYSKRGLHEDPDSVYNRGYDFRGMWFANAIPKGQLPLPKFYRYRQQPPLSYVVVQKSQRQEKIEYSTGIGMVIVDPVNLSTASNRVARGGSWGSNPVVVRSAYRRRFSPGARINTLGFRILRVAGP